MLCPRGLITFKGNMSVILLKTVARAVTYENAVLECDTV